MSRLLLTVLADDVEAKSNTLAADVHIGASDDLFDLALRLVTEGAAEVTRVAVFAHRILGVAPTLVALSGV